MPILLRSSRRDGTQEPITLRELISGRLGPPALDQEELRARRMREEFHVREQIPNTEAFNEEIVRFYKHYTKWYCGVDVPASRDDFLTAIVLRQWYKDLSRAERLAIKNQNRGMIGVIDDMTENIVRHRIEDYIKDQITQYLPLEDPRSWLPIAEELIALYGKSLFPNDPELSDTPTEPGCISNAKFSAIMITFKLEETLKEFVLRVRAMRKDWRS